MNGGGGGGGYPSFPRVYDDCAKEYRYRIEDVAHVVEEDFSISQIPLGSLVELREDPDDGTIQVVYRGKKIGHVVSLTLRRCLKRYDYKAFLVDHEPPTILVRQV